MKQYENVLLELFSRIKYLEEQNKELENRLCRLEEFVQLPPKKDLEDLSDLPPEQIRIRQVSYTKMTKEMIDVCYEYGKKLFQNPAMEIASLADAAASTTGMNRNSAYMYIYVVDAMLKGEVFKRAISQKATDKYLSNIFSDYGKTGLKKAIQATRLHIDYRRELGHTVDSLEALCNQYQQKL